MASDNEDIHDYYRKLNEGEKKLTKTEVHKVENLQDPSKPWCLRWQSPTMAAPAFWYYETEEEAREAERKFRA